MVMVITLKNTWGREKQVLLCVEGEYGCDWFCITPDPLKLAGARSRDQIPSGHGASYLAGLCVTGCQQAESLGRRVLQGSGWRCSRSAGCIQCTPY